MEHSEKINYLDIAYRIVGYHFEKRHLDMLVCLYDAVLKKKGNLTINDITQIQTSVEERHKLIEEAIKQVEADGEKNS